MSTETLYISNDAPGTALAMIAATYLRSALPAIKQAEQISFGSVHGKLADAVVELANRTGAAKGVLGSDDAERGEILEWLGKVQFGYLTKNTQKDVRTLDEHLKSRTFVASKQLSAADLAIYAASHTFVSAASQQERTSVPSVARHYDLIQNLPEVQQALARLPQHPISRVEIDLDDVPVIDRKAEVKVKKDSKPKDTDQLPTPSAKEQASEPAKASAAAKEAKSQSGESGKKKKSAESGGGGGKGSAAPPAADATPMPHMLDLRVGKIIEVKRHPDADSLYVEQVDVGEAEPRTIVSGLVKYINIEDMQNRYLVAVCNMKPANMRGIKSFAMVLAATSPDGKEGHGSVELVDPPKESKPGDRVYFDGFEGDYKPLDVLNPKKKQFEVIQPGFTTLPTKEAAWIDKTTQTVHKIVTDKGRKKKSLHTTLHPHRQTTTVPCIVLTQHAHGSHEADLHALDTPRTHLFTPSSFSGSIPRMRFAGLHNGQHQMLRLAKREPQRNAGAGAASSATAASSTAAQGGSSAANSQNAATSSQPSSSAPAAPTTSSQAPPPAQPTRTTQSSSSSSAAPVVQPSTTSTSSSVQPVVVAPTTSSSSSVAAIIVPTTTSSTQPLIASILTSSSLTYATAVVSVSSLPLPSVQSHVDSDTSSSSTHTGTIVGIAAGALVGLVVLSGLVTYFVRTKGLFGGGRADDGIEEDEWNDPGLFDKEKFKRMSTMIGEDDYPYEGEAPPGSAWALPPGVARHSVGQEPVNMAGMGRTHAGLRPPSMVERHILATQQQQEDSLTTPSFVVQDYAPASPTFENHMMPAQAQQGFYGAPQGFGALGSAYPPHSVSSYGYAQEQTNAFNGQPELQRQRSQASMAPSNGRRLSVLQEDYRGAEDDREGALATSRSGTPTNPNPQYVHYVHGGDGNDSNRYSKEESSLDFHQMASPESLSPSDRYSEVYGSSGSQSSRSNSKATRTLSVRNGDSDAHY
ncbi:uncharacterized protein L969DRAFT_619259 [Mixia osmundae IAM 14324]|uniref:tRNA-binding domain-containing protein n=1 Tax=Mixia osmundae (strain CBS 9802 / IAM 14324 / JCM 22182 / KY 12970) TaxID=764103 RepID=G7E9G3_MIXOS|nr:uncharacterized protein L969DRAFT_619259 [Mixia osmundae IAM 14324]KEI39915.1 hypothetical protein L969DRAFT_619259 [Mixia osmundae IAM 14324]GAA99282.1 hypothetical protein E5Q_05977 [Mixia osmundae IAM 14324]